jgi:hypothetical protein
MAPWDGITFTQAYAGIGGGNTSYQNSDKSVIYYEINAANTDVSQNVLYEAVDDVSSGLGLYHAVVEVDNVSIDLSGLFEIKVDGNDLDDGDAADLLFKVHSDTNTLSGAFNGLADQSVVPGAYAATDSIFKKDYVRHMAYKITGGYASADIFANEAELVTDVQRAINAAVTILEGKWTDLSENEFVQKYTVGHDKNNILVDLAELKFKRELQKAVSEMDENNADGTLYDYVDGSGEMFPILSKLLNDAQQSSDVSAECTFGFGETRLNADGLTQNESLVFHINISVGGGTLPDNRNINTIIDDVRTYKVVLNLNHST